MKIYIDLPWGGHLHIQREPREPMDRDRFCMLCLLAVVGMFVVLLMSAAK